MGNLKAKIREAGGFQNWFVNSFWFHYKWVVLAIVVVAAVVIYITADAVHQENYDAKIVIASKTYMEEENLTALTDALASGLEDLNGDGKVNVYCEIVYTGEGDLATNSQERMYLYMTEEEYVIYLMDWSVASVYASTQLEYFTDALADYGLPSMEDNPYLMDLSGNAVLEEVGLDNMYLAIMDHSTRTHEEEDIERTAHAVDMIQALLAQ
jgi:hypothetical protein